ncbi:MAG: hypothetical protein H6617_06870 [Bdellovibrionaceae bacterium]|nr:hypothetical protein [Bdellovibrionales bacterium]MCB9254388.1 hypothetical protein [Pseudobdellovibrionaceae bacterium]
MKFYISLALTLIFVVGCADALSPGESRLRDDLFSIPSNATRTPTALRGIWGRDERGGNIDFAVRLALSAREIVIGNRCTFQDGTVLYAFANVSVRYENNRIIATGSATGRRDENNKTCFVSLALGSWSFSIDPTQLKINGLSSFGGSQTSGTGTQVGSQVTASGWLKLADTEVSSD